VLVLEIVALRLVGPYVGVTLQVSSSVIGISLAAIAYGTWIGGRLADRFDPRALLAPALILAAIGTAVTLPRVRWGGEFLGPVQPGRQEQPSWMRALAVAPTEARNGWAVTPSVAARRTARPAAPSSPRCRSPSGRSWPAAGQRSVARSGTGGRRVCGRASVGNSACFISHFGVSVQFRAGPSVVPRGEPTPTTGATA
jgi:hypothetical protein